MANLTQQSLAERLGLSTLSVIKYEGGTTIPSREAMLRIYQLTGGLVTPNDFFDLESVPMDADIASDSTFVAAGLMSGTSMDGIDGALLITDGEGFIKDLGNYVLKYDSEFKLLLKACERACFENSGNMEQSRLAYENVVKSKLSQLQSVSDAEVTRLYDDLCFYFHGEKNKQITFDDVVRRSTDLHSSVVQELLKETEYRARSVDVLGYHGQTIFHSPASGITVQIGDGQRLADQCGITVVYDFRSNDVRNGGQGAPFAPLYHRALAKQIGLVPVVIANCGGISSITIIGLNDDELYAYDCGPGTALIDKLVHLKVGKEMDKDGIYGSQGTVDAEVLQLLKEKAIQTKNNSNYLEKKPPKSLDVNDLLLIPEVQSLSLQNGCATLEAFTAQCMVESLSAVPISVPKLWVLAGGGWQNKMITRELEKKLGQLLGSDVRIQHADQVGWNGQAMEAQIFAYLAVRSLRKMPLSLPGTTGVPIPLTGGEIAFHDSDPAKTTRRVRSVI